MDKRILLLWEAAGIFIIFILGFIIHFGYQWLGGFKPLAGVFAVNESVWEHCKLTFWSPLIFGLIELLFINKMANNFMFAKAVSVFITTVVMLLLFYTYTGIIGYNTLWADISVFLIAVFVGQCVSYKLLTASMLPNWLNIAAGFFIGITIFIFYYLTFNPIRSPFFRDSITGFYGIQS